MNIFANRFARGLKSGIYINNIYLGETKVPSLYNSHLTRDHKYIFKEVSNHVENKESQLPNCDVIF